MSFASDILPTLFAVRAIPGQLGIRPYSVAIITDTWMDHVGGNGFYNGRNPVPIVEAGGQPPKVDFESEDPLTKGTCTIGPITPPYNGGGTALAKLQQMVFEEEAAYVLLTGPRYPQGARFAVTKVETDKALHWTLICEHSDFQPA